MDPSGLFEQMGGCHPGRMGRAECGRNCHLGQVETVGFVVAKRMITLDEKRANEPCPA
jgi:hypothetical protein